MRVRIALLAVVLMTTAVQLFAQSVLYFPRVISTPQSFTGLALSNPTSTDASVTFSAFQPDGTLFTAPGVQNPLTVTIPAGGQYAKLSSEIFPGSGTFNGWIEGTSSNSGLLGFFLNANNAITDVDGAGAGIAKAEFTLPLASEDAQAKTELTILNPNSEAANATLTLYATDGSALATQNLSIAGNALIRQTLQPIFGNIDLTNASHVHVRSDSPVVGLEVVVNFQIPQIATRRETIDISSQQASAAQDYVLPEFVSGGGWASYLNIVNGSGLSQDVTVTAYKDDGTLWDLPANPTTLTLPGNGSLKETVEQFFGLSPASVNTGWIKIHSPLGFVISNVGYGNVDTPSFAVVSGVDVPDASPLNAYSQVAEGNGFFTGLTMVNPGSQPANVEFYTLRPDGTTVGKSTFTIGPNQRTGKLFREMLPASFGQVGGWAFLRSSAPIIGATLFGSTNGAALANVPAQTPVADFIPPAQTTAAITGTVHQDINGVAGATVTLTGPVTTSLITDFSGLFAFTQLPPGQYTVSVNLAGAQFFPSQQTVTVAQSNVNSIDFNAVGVAPAGAPTISFISPSSIFGGSSSLSITVLGSNFNQASSIYLNGQQLPTSYIDDTRLTAAVPSAMIATPGTLSVTVVTPPPGGGTSNSAALAVNVLPTNPLIGGRVGVGNFPSGVAIHPGRQIALISNEAGDSVTVVDLKTLQTVTDIKVGRSPSEGIAVYADKDLAVVANTGSNNVSVIDLTTNQVVKTIDVQSFPIGVAIDSTTGHALVTNFKNDSVSVIDLSSLTVIAMISGLNGPSGIAVNPNTKVAVVTNRTGNSVSLIDLTSNSITASVPVGQYPRGVAIDLNTNVAVVANANSNTVSIVSLATHSVLGTVTVGMGPTGVAVHQITNIAVVTNSGVTGGNTALYSVNSVSFVDLYLLKDMQDVEVESGPFGVDVDSDMQEAVVANYGSNDVTVVRIPNPTPSVTDVEPKTFPAGGAAFTMTVTGTGFLPTSVVTINGQPLPTTYISPTQLQAVVSGAILQQLLQPQVSSDAARANGVTAFAATAPINIYIGVSNPGPGGGTSPPPKDPTVTRIQPQNPSPVLISMSPTKTTADVSQLQLTLSGNNFNGTSIVSVGGGSYAPSSVTSTAITVVIPATALSPGDFPVSVTNPAPGGGTSGALTFTVSKTANPAPSITTVAPAQVAAGSNATAIHITGSGFISSAAVSIQGGSFAATVTSTSIDFTVPANLLATAGSISGLVTNPAPGGGSASFTINVTNPAPSVTGISPQEASSGIGSLAVTVSGSHFIASSVVTVEGTPVSTQMVNPGQLTGTLSGPVLARVGKLHVGVTNAAPGGGTAAAGILTLDPGVPRLDSISPSSIRADQAGTALTLAGTNFADGATVLFGEATLPATFVSASQLKITLPVPVIFGKSSVVVKNPAPGGSSNSVDFTITPLVPVINSIQPSPVATGQTITISGSNFGIGSTVTIGGVTVASNAVSDTQITAVVPSTVPAGTNPVTVVNPSPGGGTSNTSSIQIKASIATITGLTPSTVTRDQVGEIIAVSGTGFANGAAVQLDGTPAATTFVSDKALTFALPALTHAGAVNVTVVNPPPGGGTSVPSTLNVLNPAPVLGSVSPTSGVSGSSITITLGGSGFVSDSQVTFGGTTVPTVFVNSTTLTATVALVSTGEQAVVVVNGAPGGGSSNSISFTVNKPPNGLPVITSVSPATVGGNGGTTITINGTGFVVGATVSISGSSVAAVVSPPGSITATLPVLSPGSYNVVVTNPPPGGGASNGFALTVISTPTITAVSPGIVAPGSSSFTMTITGANFGTSTSAVSVALGSTSLSPTAVTTNQVTVNIPAVLLASATSYPVVVAVNGVTSSSAVFDVAVSDTFAANLSHPGDLVFDNQNNVFVANNGTGSILKISPLGAVSTYATGFSIGGPSGLALSSTGDLYVADAMAGTISKVSSTGMVTGFASGLNQPGNIRFDGAGNLLVANSGDGTIQTITPDGVISTYATLSGAAPFGLTMDSTGAVYASDYTSGAISRITGNDSTPTTFAFMDKQSDAIALDAGSRLFVANGSEGNIRRMETDGRAALVVSGLTANGPIPMAFDPSGVLFVGANGSLLRYAAQVSTVPSASPFVSRMEPAVGTPGNTVSASILGSGLTNASAVNFSSSSVTAAIQGEVTGAAVTVNVAVATSASAGPLTFTVSTPAGATNSSPFAVVGLPAITSITPTAVTATSDPFVLTVTGSNFQSDALIQFGGMTLVPTVRQSNQLTANVPSTAVLNIGVINVSASTAGAVSNALQFTIKTPVTSVTISPSEAPVLTAIGSTTQFQATARDANGNVVSGKVFSWASSNTGVASVDNTGLVTAVGNGQATITATVDGVSGTTTLAVSQVLASISISPAAATLVSVGATQQFGLTLKDANGNGINNLTAVWSSSPTAVATVDAGTGVATAVAAGTTTIKATVGNQSATATLTVAPAVASIVVSPATATLQSLNLTQAFSAVAKDANGNPISGKTFTWSSDNPAVASINSSTGVVTSVGDGGSTPITIRATVDGQVGTATIVISPQVASVTVSPSSTTIASLGATQQLTATVKDANNQTLTTKTVTWSVDKPDIATVDPAKGIVKAVTNGTAVITATAGGQSGSVAVTVSQVVQNISVSPARATLTSINATQPFTATLTDALGNPVSGQTVSWSSNSTSVATVSSAGVATSNSNGTATITATVGNISASATLTVAQTVATVSLSPASKTLSSIGATFTFILTVSDANGTAITGLPVTWTTSHPEFATVTNGTVKAVANGSTMITATVGGKSATAQVIVKQDVDSIEVSIVSGTALPAAAPRVPGRLTPSTAVFASVSSQLASLGDSVQFQAVALDALGNTVPGQVITWVSSRPDLASVDSTGKTTAIQNGTIVIAASVGSVSGTANVTVQQVVASVTLQPSSRTFASFGETQAFQATPFDARGNQITVKTVTWSAGSPVSVDTTGLVTAGTTEGTSTLTATIDGKSATAGLTVAQVAVSITISPSTITLMTLPGAQDFTVVAKDARGNAVNKPITWSSSAPGVASINASGHATATANGRAIISATIGNTTGFATLNVAQGSARIELSEGSHTFRALKDSVKIIASYFDANGNPGTPALTWVSDTPNVATLDQAGNITAVGNGMATVTVSANGVSATITVVVAQVLNGVVITDLGSGSVKAFGGKRSFSAVGVDSNGNTIAGKTVSWKSSDISIASIDSTGAATGNGNGTVTITATIDNLSQTITLVVKQQVASIVSLNGTGIITALKRSRQFQAVDANGFAISGKTIVWASSATGVATVDGTGLATAQGNGSTNITATVDGVTVSTTLTVLQDVANIQVTSDTTGIIGAIKSQRHFTANGRDPDGYAVVGETVTWTAIDSTIVSIDANGVATSQKNGKTSITATINGFQSLPVDFEVLQVTSSVSIQGDNSNIVALNRKRSFKAVALDSNGNAITGKSASWTSSAADTLPIDVNGTVTALKNGSSTIQATIDGIVGSLSLTVNQVVDHLLASDTGIITALYRTRSYTAVDIDGNQIAGKTVIWSSLPPAVATVDTNGKATAIGNGTTTISATVDGITVSATLQVHQQVQTVIVTSVETGTIVSLNHKRQLQVHARDIDGYDVNDSSRTTTWSSSDSTTAFIDTTGLATSKKNGVAYITVVYDGVSSSAVLLQISQVIASIQSTVTGTAKSKGEKRQYTAYDAEGSPIQKTITWAITGDTSVATIDQTGLLTTTENNSAMVTATVDTTMTFSLITVQQVAKSITVTSGNTSLARVGKTTAFQATAYDANGYVVEDKTITWSVSDSAVATIGTTGNVVAVSPGTTTVYASMDGVTVSFTLTVH